jgi:hypothetical protein
LKTVNSTKEQKRDQLHKGDVGDRSTTITTGIYYNEEDRIVRMVIWVVLMMLAVLKKCNYYNDDVF